MSLDSAWVLLSPAIVLEKSAAITLQSQQGRSLESILQSAIADVRALLQTDRVLLYRFLEDQDAVIVAESVGTAWKPLRGQLVSDPCANANWVDRYKQGHTTSIADIHEGMLAPCYVQFLERLQVQANLVVPIFSQGTLWGLLIAHHCRSPREWQPLARQLLQHIAVPLGMAIQQAAPPSCPPTGRTLAQPDRPHPMGGDRWWPRGDRHRYNTNEPAHASTNELFERVSSLSLGLAAEIRLQQDAQAALQQQAERQRLLTTIAQHLRRTLDLDQILQTTVTEVRQFLQTDRVIVYRFAPDWSGSIIAEAVAAGWQSILGMQITDTDLVATQGHSIQQGGIKGTNDIYAANLAPCHVAMLEEMQVRATLVVPIVQGDRLWGLLVAQQCRSPRLWEAAEIELQQQLATQIEIAIQQAALYQQSQLALAERQHAETALQRLNQKLEERVQVRTQALHQQAEQERLLRSIIQSMHRSFDLEETLTTVLNDTRQSLKADRVAVYQFHPDWNGSFVAESVGAGWVPLVHPEHPKVWEDTHLQATQGGRYQYNEMLTVNDIHTIGHSPCHLDLLRQFQARAYVIAPIILDDHLWGLLAIYQNSGPREWQQWEISLLQQLGIQMAIALRQAYSYQAAQVQVQELERLNQLKDDFLSTVSHELRTPMSSIKMATQMLEISLQPLGVLDDVSSSINRYFKILQDEGRRELTLINDLLDLTRLDAGTEPLQLTTIALQVYIPHLAEAFIERARAHQQQLTIHIPADLPPFTTDLSYLERIVTELLQNACKYTPAGGAIVVSVQFEGAREAGKDTETRRRGDTETKATQNSPPPPHPPTLLLTVSNSGVEIPAAECDRIFDKFYRIPNNDPWKHGGTGLGLALVKKLTERLGGQIHVTSGGGQTTFRLVFECFR